MLVHPDPAMQGKNEIDLKDINGRQEKNKAVTREEGIMGRTMTMKAVLLISAVTVLGTLASGQARNEGSSAQDVMVKNEVETAISMLQAVNAKVQKGKMTRDQAKQLGADLLRGLRYGKDGYFWADTTEGVNVVLYGRKDVEGKNRLESKDAKGNFIVKEFIATAKAGGGYVNYWFPKMNQTTPLPKRSYVQLFKPFGWVVGAGYYLK